MKTKQKQIMVALCAITVSIFTACGPSEAERKAQAEAEQARIDSIAQVKADSIAQIKAEELAQARMEEIARQKKQEEENSISAWENKCYEAGYRQGYTWPYFPRELTLRESSVFNMWKGYSSRMPLELMENPTLKEKYFEGARKGFEKLKADNGY